MSKFAPRSIAIVLWVFATGCTLQTKTQESQVRTDDNDQSPASQITHDCFTKLAPMGPLMNGTYAGARFINGTCIGQGIAVSKIASVTEVKVHANGQTVSSRLLADKKDVLVEVKGKRIKIGEVVSSDYGTEMKLADSTDFELRVGESRDRLNRWTAKDKTRAAIEEVHLFVDLD